MISREFNFLLACVRSELTDTSLNSAGLIDGQFCWSAFVRLANRHKLIPAVCEACEGCSDIPSSVKDRLQRARQAIVMKNFRLATQLRETASTFEKAGVAFYAFKGPTLAIQLHGGLDQRQFSDLDIMIRPQDLRGTLEALQRLGYDVDGPQIQQLTDHGLRKLVRRINEHTLLKRGREGCTKIDLHWNHSEDPAFFETPRMKLFDQFETCTIGDRPIPTAPFQHTVVYLAWHAVKHQCMRLSWLYDFALAMNQIPKAKWSSFLSSLNKTHQRYVISALLMLERTELMHPLDGVVPDIDKWRSTFAAATRTMYQELTKKDAEPLRGALASGIWKWRLSGRVRPLWNSIVKSVQPAPADLMAEGVVAAQISRLRYFARLFTAAVSQRVASYAKAGEVRA